MSQDIAYNPRTGQYVCEERSGRKNCFIYVWGEEGGGYLVRAKFGGRYKVSVTDNSDPKKGKRMTESKALGLFAKLTSVGIQANFVCFPNVTILH